MFNEKKTGSLLRETTGKEKFSCRMCGDSSTIIAGNKQEYEYRCCQICGFVFCPQITPQYLSNLYSKGYHGPDDGAPKKGWSNVNFLDEIWDVLPKKALTIFDFGCGQSLVANHLRLLGHKTLAVDIAPPLHPHPDRLTGDLLELALEPDVFDFVYSFQVFEHLPEPRPVLEELLRLTKPGGYILIHTDMETRERDSEGFENWWYVAPPDHCSFFRHKTFEKYLADKPHYLISKTAKSVVIKKQ